MIKVENLSVQYGRVYAVSDVSFSIGDGEAFGILGRNGAGKTTLVETMAGLRKKTSGSVWIDGVESSEKKRRAELYQTVSVQLQSTNYPDQARVGEICRLFASLYTDHADVRALLQRFDLSDRVRQPVRTLSGGQKQRLSILLALLSRPRVVFLDELTTGLDADARHELWKYLKGLKKDGVTLILVTHFMDDVEMLCDRVGIMHEGRLVNAGTREQLTDVSGLARRVTFSCDRDITTLLHAMEGVARVDCLGDRYTVVAEREDFPEKCLALLSENKVAYGDFFVSRPCLEDAFLQIIRKNGGRNENA